MALFAVGCSRQCSEAVMKESPSAISVGPDSFRVTPWVFGAMRSMLLPCSSSCTRSEPGCLVQTVSLFDGDEAMMINRSCVGASIVVNVWKLSFVAALNEEEMMLRNGEWKRKKKEDAQSRFELAL